MRKLFLKNNPELKDFQRYIADMENERGLSTDTFHYCLMMGEEVGELFKAIRKSEKQQIDHNSKIGSVEEELADVFIFLCAIANTYGVDLEKAFREKQEINELPRPYGTGYQRQLCCLSVKQRCCLTRILSALLLYVPSDGFGVRTYRRGEVSFRPNTASAPVGVFEDGKLLLDTTCGICF
jgi:NTP pyrophosphatase (non-canonical NTP hydrolase)